MLSAQKQKKPEDATSENAKAPASGFGKVLTSIQGLQQRLDDFSVEEVSRAHAKATDLIRQLGALHARLGALAKLQNCFTTASAAIDSRPKFDFNQVEADSLENHPQLRAIVQTGKLIRMHRLLRAAQASAEAVSIALPTEPVVNVMKLSGEVGDGAFAAPQLLQRFAEPPSEWKLEIDPSKPAAEQAPSPVTGGFTLVHSAYEPSPAKGSYDFFELKLEKADGRAARPNTVTAPTAERIARTESNKSPSRAAFDERLLSDLIDTYGEFAVSPDTGIDGSVTAPREFAPETSFTESSASPVADPTPAPAESRDLVVAESANNAMRSGDITAPEPAFVAPIGDNRLALPAPEGEKAEPAFEQTLPDAKARGEIDRQLKSIIKDYGQVDLYSHGKPVNRKTAAIAAAAALALVLGGIYFFKSPSGNPPASIEASAPAEENAPSTTAVKTGSQKK